MYVTSYDGYLYALGAADGRQLWRFRVGPMPNGTDIGGGIVYAGTNNGGLYALRAGDGAVLWHQPLGTSVLSVMTTGGAVYVSAGRWERLRVRRGGWRAALACADWWVCRRSGGGQRPGHRGPLRLHAKRFDTNPNGEVFAFSGVDGSVRWDVHMPVAPMGPPVVAPLPLG